MLRLRAYDFELVGQIAPLRANERSIEEFYPQPRYRNAAHAKLHEYGAGPFCRFVVARGRRQAGIYLIVVAELPVYVGECQNLADRFGPNGYGGISPGNCFVGGQPTNCRINGLVLSAAKSGTSIELWFCGGADQKDERLKIEAQLIEVLQPKWNRSKSVRKMDADAS